MAGSRASGSYRNRTQFAATRLFRLFFRLDQRFILVRVRLSERRFAIPLRDTRRIYYRRRVEVDRKNVPVYAFERDRCERSLSQGKSG